MEYITTLNEGQDYTFTLNTPINTTGDTLSVVFKEYTASGVGDVIGTASGVTAKTNLPITLATSAYNEGNYLMELWQELGETDQAMLFPPEGSTYKIVIQSRMRG